MKKKKSTLLLLMTTLVLSLWQGGKFVNAEEIEPVTTDSTNTEALVDSEPVEEGEKNKTSLDDTLTMNEDAVMPIGGGSTAENPYELPEEAFLWESANEKKVLVGVSPTWYKTNITDKNIEYVSVKIPTTTEKINRCFAGAYGSSNTGYSSDGSQLNSTNISDKLVSVDFSEAVNLKIIDVQAFGFVTNLTGVIDLSNTKVEEISGNAFKDTAITGVILPTTLKIIGGNPSSPGSHAPTFANCKQLAFIRTAGGDSNAIIELPTGLEAIKSGGLYLENTKIEQTMKTNPFVIHIPASVKSIQGTGFNFCDNGASAKTQFVFDGLDFSDTDFGQNCLFENSWEGSWGFVRFTSKEAYESFVTKYPNKSLFFGYPTYEFNLTFKDTGITQQKLWGLSIQYEKDSNNYWTKNNSYTLPGAPDSSTTPSEGKLGYWALDGEELKADSKLSATTATTELTAEWTVVDKLANPTITYTLNGKVQGNLSDMTPVLLNVPYLNGKPGKIGVKAVHPLLKPEEGGNGTDDNYVYFKYRWIDVQSLQLGPRSKTIEDGSGFYNRITRTAPEAKYDEVEIRDNKDNRVNMSGNWGAYTFYNCEIYGYHVQNGMEKLFYASNALGSYSLSFGDDPGLKRTTDDVFCIQAKYIDTWTITFDLNGGTAPNGVDYSPVQVKKGKAYPTPKEPLKPGYTCWGWKEKDGTKEYYLGMAIEKDQDVTLVAQYDPNNYTINYVPNLTGATGTVGPQNYEYDTADFKLTTDTFTSTTKDFLGWSLTADALTADYQPDDSVNDMLKAAMVASQDGTITLYAVWKDKDTFKVTLAENNDSKVYGVIDVAANTRISWDKVNNLVINPGYTIKGWVDENKQPWDLDQEVVTKDMTIYPVWKLDIPSVDLKTENDVTAIHTGQSIKITAKASHDIENITYKFKWFKDGVEINNSSNANNPAAIAETEISEMTVTESGAYSVKVSAIDGINISDEVECGPINITVTDHEFSNDWKYNENGHWHICKIENCGAKKDEETHTFGEWTVLKQPTSTVKGEKKRTCKICGFSEKQVIPVTGETTSSKPSNNTNKKTNGWDDGGPFTTDKCGNVFDRWGNKIYEANGCNVGGYNLVRTSVID